MTNTSKDLWGTFPSIFVMSNGCFSQPVRQSPDVLVAIKTWRLSQGVRHLKTFLWQQNLAFIHGNLAIYSRVGGD